MPFSTAIATASLVEQIYWCDECEMSINLFSPPSSSTQTLLCPHCLATFLQHISSSPSLLSPSLSSPENPQTSSPIIPFAESIHGGSAISGFLISRPASIASIDAIPTIKISSSLPDFDPVLLCAICMDQLEVDEEAKQLPCNHFYHCNCILPWLSSHNSCPVCRSELPADEDSDMITEEDDLFEFGSTLRHINRRNLYWSPAI